MLAVIELMIGIGVAVFFIFLGIYQLKTKTLIIFYAGTVTRDSEIFELDRTERAQFCRSRGGRWNGP